MADPPDTKVFAVERHELSLKFLVFSYFLRCVNVAAELCSESCFTQLFQGDLRPVQAPKEILSYWSELSAHVRQLLSYTNSS